jgi:hypothetical protein
MEYINCLMGKQGAFADQPYAQFARDCATKVQVKNFEASILNCANSTEGSQYLQAMGEMTFKLMDPLKSVPTITIRESYDDNIQKASLTSFASTVCNNLPKPYPAVCRSYSSATSVSSSFVVGIVALFAAISRMF